MTKSRGILGPRRAWTEYEDQVLREHYATTLTADLAELLGRQLSSTHQRARKLGLAKDLAVVADWARERSSRPDHGGKAHQFKPGVPSWSKGTKGRVGVQEGCKATQFKPGRPAQEARNYVPIGSLRVTRDGILERKTTDDPSVYPARRWTSVARLVWIDANGPIPEGHLVRFKPGMHTTEADQITVDKLECVSRAGHARMNVQQVPIEIRRLTQLRGAVTRAINKRAKETT